tara:strand:+ start:82 stop:519 length:438 start_codon:yes stop_codon:yes gene_type:complete
MQTFLFNYKPVMNDTKDNSFDKFYKLYPRKIGRFMAKKAFHKLSDRDKYLAYNGLLDYIRFWKHNKTEKQFIPHPSTWLNQRRWEDEIDLPKTKQQKTSNVNKQVMEYRRMQQRLLDDAADTDDIKDALSGFLGKRNARKYRQDK